MHHHRSDPLNCDLGKELPFRSSRHHSPARKTVRAVTRCAVIVQGDQTFNGALMDAVQRVAETGDAVASLQPAASHSDDQTLHLIRSLGPQVDGLAVVSKNTEPVKAALAELRATGKPVVALVSDLDPQVRSAYAGINNRAAGQLAAFLAGRCLERIPQAEVAVVVGGFAYRCHEDREIGFRALLRRRFPHIEVIEALKGEDSPEATRLLPSRSPACSRGGWCPRGRRPRTGRCSTPGRSPAPARVIDEQAVRAWLAE